MGQLVSRCRPRASVSQSQPYRSSMYRPTYSNCWVTKWLETGSPRIISKTLATVAGSRPFTAGFGGASSRASQVAETFSISIPATLPSRCNRWACDRHSRRYARLRFLGPSSHRRMHPTCRSGDMSNKPTLVFFLYLRQANLTAASASMPSA